MKKYLFVLFFATLIACDYKPQSTKKHYIHLKTVEALQGYLSYDNSNVPLVSAHRGGPMPGYPENAIETFENALNYGSCILEFDVAKTSDGVLVLMHDDTLERTTNGKGNISSYSFEELQNLRLKDNDGKITSYKIPTFENVLLWGKNKAIMSIDVKKGIEPKEIVAMIHKADAKSHCIVIVYNQPMLQQYHKLDNDLVISTSATSVKAVESMLSLGIPSKNVIAFVGVYEPDLKVYEILHKNGIKAILGTMHNLDNSAKAKGKKIYQELIKNGADILATDEVKLAISAIKNMKK